jgi:hypothetical protein
MGWAVFLGIFFTNSSGHPHYFPAQNIFFSLSKASAPTVLKKLRLLQNLPLIFFSRRTFGVSN